MNPKRTLALSLVATLVMTAVVVTTTTAHHDPRIDQRIVHPYNIQVITHVPVVAGYEPLPAPQHCQTGAIALDPVYQEDFEVDHGWEFIATPLAASGTNLWHVTDHHGGGSDGDKQGDQRLYFGHSEGGQAGSFLGEQPGRWHPAGTAQSPPVQLPLTPTWLTFDTKWEVEYLIGYDHLWVEMLDEDGTTHLLCTANSMGRVDPAGVGGQSDYQSCSPFHASPCPTLLDPSLSDTYPAWEQRSIPIPSVLAGQEVQIRFTLDASDSAANWMMGWQVDDVRIGAPV